MSHQETFINNSKISSLINTAISNTITDGILWEFDSKVAGFVTKMEFNKKCYKLTLSTYTLQLGVYRTDTFGEVTSHGFVIPEFGLSVYKSKVAKLYDVILTKQYDKTLLSDS